VALDRISILIVTGGAVTYSLPDLPYDYAALEPHLSGQILELHHDKHHAGYVTGANTAVEKLAEARDKGDFANLTALEKNLAFHVSGHLLHSLYWQNMSPDGGGQPEGDLAAAVDEQLGGYEGLKAQMSQVVSTVQGSGWAALSWDSLGQRLVIHQILDHQDNVAGGSLPIFVIDAWEHAFYLQYKNVKGDYVKAFWNVVNWNDVAQRFGKVRGVQLP
jgi:Fe-Mn family superoxide dismutase